MIDYYLVPFHPAHDGMIKQFWYFPPTLLFWYLPECTVLVLPRTQAAGSKIQSRSACSYSPDSLTACFSSYFHSVLLKSTCGEAVSGVLPKKETGNSAAVKKNILCTRKL